MSILTPKLIHEQHLINRALQSVKDMLEEADGKKRELKIVPTIYSGFEGSFHRGDYVYDNTLSYEVRYPISCTVPRHAKKPRADFDRRLIEALNTMLHEERHLRQHTYLFLKDDPDSQKMAIFNLASYEDGFYKGDPENYIRQPFEVDAETWAIMNVKDAMKLIRPNLADRKIDRLIVQMCQDRYERNKEQAFLKPKDGNRFHSIDEVMEVAKTTRENVFTNDAPFQIPEKCLIKYNISHSERKKIMDAPSSNTQAELIGTLVLKKYPELENHYPVINEKIKNAEKQARLAEEALQKAKATVAKYGFGASYRETLDVNMPY